MTAFPHLAPALAYRHPKQRDLPLRSRAFDYWHRFMNEDARMAFLLHLAKIGSPMARQTRSLVCRWQDFVCEQVENCK